MRRRGGGVWGRGRSGCRWFLRERGLWRGGGFGRRRGEGLSGRRGMLCGGERC